MRSFFPFKKRNFLIKEIKFLKDCAIDIEDDDELVKFHLENNFQEHMDLLSIDDFTYEED